MTYLHQEYHCCTLLIDQLPDKILNKERVSNILLPSFGGPTDPYPARAWLPALQPLVSAFCMLLDSGQGRSCSPSQLLLIARFKVWVLLGVSVFLFDYLKVVCSFLIPLRIINLGVFIKA